MGLSDELRSVVEGVSAADLRRRFMQVLKASGSIELTDMAAHRAFRGVHFGSIEKAAADYVKKGLVSMTGTKLSLKESQGSSAASGIAKRLGAPKPRPMGTRDDGMLRYNPHADDDSAEGFVYQGALVLVMDLEDGGFVVGIYDTDKYAQATKRTRIDLSKFRGGQEAQAGSFVKETVSDLEEGAITERESGGAAFDKAWRLWGKSNKDLLMLTTQLRVALEVVKKTPGYEMGRGRAKDRPGATELESGLKHMTAAIRDLRVGFDKMSETTFLEDWDGDNDGIGLDDKKKRKKPTDLKDMEAEKAKKDKKAAKAAAAAQAAQPVDPNADEEQTEARLLSRLGLMVEGL